MDKILKRHFSVLSLQQKLRRDHPSHNQNTFTGFLEGVKKSIEVVLAIDEEFYSTLVSQRGEGIESVK